MKTMMTTAMGAALAMTMTTPAFAASVLDQNQPLFGNYLSMSIFNQNGNAQSFKPSASNVSGAGIYMFAWIEPDLMPSPADITISLWTALPNAGGTQLAAATFARAPLRGWIDVFWSPVSVTAGSTYFLVFGAAASAGVTTTDWKRNGIAGTTYNSYAGGQTYALTGFVPFPDFDYTFRTYADDGTTPPIPEPASWAMMIGGLGLAGAAMRRQKVALRFA